METYKVSVMSGEGEITIKEFEKPIPQRGQVLIKVDACAICTLEQRVYRGVMKYYPFAGGHEVSGVVEAVGEGVHVVKSGDNATVRILTSCGECYYCRNGHENQCVVSFIASTHKGLNGPGGLAEYMLVDSKSVYKMADDIELSHAALAEPLACCVHSVRQGQIKFGDDVVVIGIGIMGALHIQLAKLRGARVIACELDENRLEIAKQMGADVLINSGKEDAVARVKEITEHGADAVFCTVPVSKLAKDAVDMAGKLGRIVMYTSFNPDTPIEISPKSIHSTEKIITGSVNPKREDFLAATRLLSNKSVDVSKLISKEYSFEQINEAFEDAIKPDRYRIVVKM